MMRIGIFLLSLIITACSNVNSKAIEYREVHVEPKKGAIHLPFESSNVDVTQGEKITPISKKLDFFYDKLVA
jgi:hypothetical protein